MAACRGQQCKLCRFGGGVCQTGFRKVHVREDPECRLHGVTGRMNIRAPQPQLVPQPPPTAVEGNAAATPPPPSAPTAAGRTAEASLDRKTHFLTKGGLHLLYEPTAEDRWISRHITTCDEGEYIDNQTGEVLSRQEAASYESYQQRLCERHRVGEQADRLVRIVDRHMPRVADENRAYVLCHALPAQSGGDAQEGLATSQENPQTTKGRRGEGKA